MEPLETAGSHNGAACEHSRLLPLLRHAATPGESQTVLEIVLAFIADRLLHTWTDADADRCEKEAQIVGHLFRNSIAEVSSLVTGVLSEAEQREARRLAQQIRAQIPREVFPAVLHAAVGFLLGSMQDDRHK